MIWYRVQIGAYALKRSAEKVSVDLIENGFKTSITKEKGLYKVRIGSFQDKTKAEKLLARVHKYKQYKKAKILEWNDGKDLPIIDLSGDKEEDYHPIIKFTAIWLSETDESMYGDAQVFVEYAPNGIDILHAVLVDTGMHGCDTIKKLKKIGVKTLDAVVISHAHGDHYGYLTEILKQFKVLHLYLPNVDGVRKYQKTYAQAIDRQAAKAKKLKIPVTYMTTGSEFKIGHIECTCVFQANADKLKKHDNHYFVNNMSTALLFVLDGIGHVLLTGDMSNEANRLFMKAYGERLNVDIAKCGWHADGGAMLEEYAEFVNSTGWYWNYHHSKNNGGRTNTLRKLLGAGVKEHRIYMNYEDGDITFTYHNGCFTVTKSKDKKYAYVFTAKHYSAA